jgi:hypothetical protein
MVGAASSFLRPPGDLCKEAARTKPAVHNRIMQTGTPRPQEDLNRALAAYNTGPERVEQVHGVPRYPEIRRYIARIIRDFNRTKAVQRRLQPDHANNRTLFEDLLTGWQSHVASLSSQDHSMSCVSGSQTRLRTWLTFRWPANELRNALPSIPFTTCPSSAT